MDYKGATINVIEGDITSIPATAIVTLINSGGMWFGGLDSAIQSVAGNYYHSQAASHRLRDGQVIVAEGKVGGSGLAFEDVIFVVDDLKMQLNDLVFVAIEEACQRNYASVSLPLMRTGVMRNVVEKVSEVPAHMVNGIMRAVDLYECPMMINIVAYRDTSTAKALLLELQKLR